MSSWSLHYSTKAEKDIQKLDPNTRQMIVKAIELLLEKPPQGDLKMLTGLKGFWRIRVGEWRIIYSRSKANKTFVITRVLRRSTTTYS